MASRLLLGLLAEDELSSDVTSSREGDTGLVALLCWGIGFVVFWLFALQLAACTHDRWTACFPLSKKAHENNRHYNARSLVGTFHAICVSCATVPAAFFMTAQQEVQYMYTDNLEFCTVDRSLLVPEQFHAFWIGPVVGLAGLAFTTFMTADVFYALAHGFMTPDYMVHHAAFIAAGVVIRTHCMLPYNAAILLTMEVSTPFLNYLLFVRHRGDGFKLSSSISGVLFFVSFVLFRIVFNTCGAVYFIMHKGDWFRQVPAWQGWFLIIAIVLGSGIQFFWLPQIMRVFCKACRGFVSGSDDPAADVSDSETPSSDVQSLAEANERREVERMPLKDHPSAV